MKLDKSFLKSKIQKSALVILIVFIIIAFSIITKGLFISSSNISNILIQSALTGIVGVGMTFVLLTGGIDLSVSGNVVMTSLFLASFMKQGVGWIPSLLLALLISTLVGFINGLAISKIKMVPFVTTLAMSNITMGLGEIYSNGQTIYGLDARHEVFGQGHLLGIPVPIIMWAIVALIAYYILTYTSFGREVYAVGSNQKAAWMAGISTNVIILITYAIGGLTCGFGAILVTSQLMSASSTVAASLTLDAIAACVIGGTSLNGGVGSVGGTILGAIAMALINNGLNLVGASPFMQDVAKGVIIFIVVAVDAIQRNRRDAKE
jgi:ribose/xylose/arabinose/galactoside ABC-type transport system permease subunit